MRPEGFRLDNVDKIEEVLTRKEDLFKLLWMFFNYYHFEQLKSEIDADAISAKVTIISNMTKCCKLKYNITCWTNITFWII